MLWRQVVATTLQRPGTPEPVAPTSFRGSFSGRERDVFFHNPQGRGPFIDLGYSLGLDFIDDGRVVVPIDFDGDGDLDLATASLQRLRLLENRIGGRFLRVRVDDLGAEVRVHTGDVVQRDFVKLVSGFMSQVPRALHFGLGVASVVDRVEVTWPDGTIDSVRDVPADRLLVWRRGAPPTVKPLPSWPSRALRPGTHDGSMTVRSLDADASPLVAVDRTTIVNFWAPWCEPCRAEAPSFAALAKRKDVDVVGVSLEVDNLASVREAAADWGLDYAHRLADEALLASFFGGDGEATIPATFVFGPQRRLRRAYHRPIEPGELDALLDSISGTPPRAHDFVILGDGALGRGDLDEAERRYRQAIAADSGAALALTQLGAVLTRKKDGAAAVQVLLRATKAAPDLPYAWYRLGWAHRAQGDLQAATAAFERAVRLDPANSTFLDGLGSTQSTSGDHAAAVGTYEKLIEAHPKSVRGWLNLGKTRALAKRPGAAQAFDKVLELDPRHAEAQALLRQVRR